MKRYSPILFIWLFNFIGVTIASFMSYQNGEIGEFLPWSISSIFMANLIVYHFYVTRNDKKKKDSQLLDE